MALVDLSNLSVDFENLVDRMGIHVFLPAWLVQTAERSNSEVWPGCCRCANSASGPLNSVLEMN